MQHKNFLTYYTLKTLYKSMDNHQKNIWIIAEQKENSIQGVSFELLAHAKHLSIKKNYNITAIVLGSNLEDINYAELIYRGADNVILCDSPFLANAQVEPSSQCLKEIINWYKPEIILASASRNGRTLMPYTAMKVDSGLTADCTELSIDENGLLLQTRPAIGGNIMATIKTPNHTPQMATVRPNLIKALPRNTYRKGEISYLTSFENDLNPKVYYEEFIPKEDKNNINDAEIVVSIGKGIKKPENIPIIEKFAKKIGAAIGASRDVVDKGWMNYTHQIGLSGKTVNPELYIALGISGTIQHLAGMQTSKTIVAVNSDPDAQIFNIADIGIVGDIFEVLPALTEKINHYKELQQ